jgi:hypothetical protein
VTYGRMVPFYVDPKVDAGAGRTSISSVGIHLRVNDPEFLQLVLVRLNSLELTFSLFISVSPECDCRTVSDMVASANLRVSEVVIEEVPRGCPDLLALIVKFGRRLMDFDRIGHFHTMHDPRRPLDLLFGPGRSSQRALYLLDAIGKDASIAIADHSRDVFRKEDGLLAPMFWSRADALYDFFELPVCLSDCQSEETSVQSLLQDAFLKSIATVAGRQLVLQDADSTFDQRYFEMQQDYSSTASQSDVKVLAYYLPQFHPIPENDMWHGTGFTEWTKVKAANPLFESHYQQHVPHPDIGYYDLAGAPILRKQLKLMKKAGVFGQVFYHYWFSGKLILERPAQLLLETEDIELPFCFCWANENWTRRWTGDETEVLLAQRYSKEDAAQFIDYLIPFFKDPRYIKIDNRPVLFIYRPSSITNHEDYIDIWKRRCADAGLLAPFLVAVLTRGASDPRTYSMDGAVERVLHDWTDGGAPDISSSLRFLPGQAFSGRVLKYADVAEYYLRQTREKDFTYFRSIVPNFDNTARYGERAYILHDSTPELFEHWFDGIVRYTDEHLPSGKKYVLVNAWNEWAEGAHLEPDTRHGYAYLNAIGRVLSRNRPLTISKDIETGDNRLLVRFSPGCLEELEACGPLGRELFLSSIDDALSCLNAIKSMETTNLTGSRERIALPPGRKDNYVLEVRRICRFDKHVIETLWNAIREWPGAVVCSNDYGESHEVTSITSMSSVDEHIARKSCLAIVPAGSNDRPQFGSYKVRTDAHCFVSGPSPESGASDSITTIIRFHRSGDLSELKNALLCLAAMKNCKVVPLVAAQDLSDEQHEAVQNMLDAIRWEPGIDPILTPYHTDGSTGDYRAFMLLESLRKVQTRYAAFLDYDDRLLSGAYDWLLSRLKQTGKSVAFGRVYRTTFDGERGVIVERKRSFEYGHSFAGFLDDNHAPLHSFLMDMAQIDVEQIAIFKGQRYMEDYAMSLQIFSADNADWEGLQENVYIGDYMHSVNRSHTLAISDDEERSRVASSREYRVCTEIIRSLQMVAKKAADPAFSGSQELR